MSRPAIRNQRIHPGNSLSVTAKGDSPGFTLLEILVAMFLFAVVISVILTSYTSLISGAQTLTDARAEQETIGRTFYRFELDLTSAAVTPAEAYKPRGTDDPPDPYRIRLENETVDGTTFSRLRLATRALVATGVKRDGGVGEVIYAVTAEEGGGYRLTRTERPFPYTDPDLARTAVLCRPVTSFRVTAVDAAGDTHETWDSDDADYDYATPRTLIVKIGFGTDSDAAHTYRSAVRLPVYRPQIKARGL